MASSSTSAAATTSAAIDTNPAPLAIPAAVAPPPPPPPPQPQPQPEPQPQQQPQPHALHVHQLIQNHHHLHFPLRRREVEFVSRAATLVLSVFLLTFIFTFIMWVMTHPSTPHIHVTSAAISNLTATNLTVTAVCNVTLSLKNPNRHMAAIYERIEVVLIYPAVEYGVLSDYYPVPFVQRRKARTAVETDLSFGGVYLREDVLEGMTKELGGGSLKLGVNVFGIVSFRGGRWKMHSQNMKAHCGNLVFRFSSGGKEGVLVDRIVECVVYLYAK